MNCRSCHAEIAEKALVCYRCGAATTDPKVAPPGAGQPRSALSLGATTLALVVLVAFVLYMQRAGSVGSSPALRWALVACAVIIVVLRGVARRARR